MARPLKFRAGGGGGIPFRWAAVLGTMPQMKPLEILLLLALLGPPGSSLSGQRSANGPYVPLPQPAMTIGAEGDPDYEFSTIVAVLRLPTGDVAVADWSTQSIRVFDPMGKLIRKLGRRGAGPGEFRGIFDLFLAGDTLIAYDGRLRRLTRFLATGALVGVQLIQPATGDGPVNLAGRLASGRWLVTTPHSPSWAQGHGTYRDTLRVGSIAASSTGAVRWVGGFPGATMFAYMPGQAKTSWAAGMLPVSASGLAAALGDTIVVGDTSTPELGYFLTDGRPVGRIPLPLDVTSDLRYQREAARDESLAGRGGQAARPYLQAQFEAPRQIPRYRDFTVAKDRRLWIRLFEERPLDLTRYLVLDPDGRVRARVSLPARSQVLAVDGPLILVALRDADDVERVGLIRWGLP